MRVCPISAFNTLAANHRRCAVYVARPFATWKRWPTIQLCYNAFDMYIIFIFQVGLLQISLDFRVVLLISFFLSYVFEFSYCF